MRQTQADAPGGTSIAPAGLQLIPTDARMASEFASEIGVDVSTVIRWIRRGCKGPPVDGRRPTVLLRAFKRGGRYLVTPADFAAFSVALLGQQAEPATAAAPGAHTAAQRRKAKAEADRICESLGA
jgi:hypothetical protein